MTLWKRCVDGMFRLVNGIVFVATGKERPFGTRTAEKQIEGSLEIIRPRDPGPQPAAPELRLALDFGTSSTSAVWAAGEGSHRLVTFGVDERGDPRYTIPSSALWVDETRPNDETVVLGPEEILLLHRPAGSVITRSFKRMLFDFEALSPVQQSEVRRRLRALFREILILVLWPRKSVSLRWIGEQGEAILTGDAVKQWREKGGLGLDQTGLAKKLVAGLEVCLCIPNSFGSQAIHVAATALRDALGDVREQMKNVVPSVGELRVRTIRESEAIAHCVASAPRDGYVMVVDVGAGTTDVALLDNVEGAPRLRQRTGIPFGGDDVDQLLVVLAAEAGKSTYSTAPLDKLTTAQKQRLLANARQRKEEWSLAHATSTPGAVLDQSDTLQNVEILAPDQSTGYEAFLRYAIEATCGPLLRDAAAQNLPLRRVVLSGSSSYLPRIQDTLTRLLARTLPKIPNVSVEITPVSEHLRDHWQFTDIDQVLQAKLACAWGAAESFWRVTEQSGQSFVSESIQAVNNEGDEISLFAAGMIMANGELSRFLPLNEARPHIFRFYRYFCPPSDFMESRHRASPWVRRMVQYLNLARGHSGMGVRYVLSDEAPFFTETLSTWAVMATTPQKMKEYPSDRIQEPPTGDEPSPVTALPMRWNWS